MVTGLKSRTSQAILLTAIWAVVAIVAMFLCIIRYGFSEVMVLLGAVISLLMQGLGVVIYLGNADMLAGFNTMSESERSEYNMDQVAFGAGIMFMIEAYVALLFMPAGDDLNIFVLAFVLFIVVLIFGIIWLNAGKRFKAKT